MPIGVDTGGTFTDLVLLRPDGSIETAKRPSTPADFSAGVMDVVAQAEVGNGALLAEAGYFYHGTTVATNAMITGSGAKIGFVTTAGHRDALPMMRIIGRSAGRSETELKQYSYTDKPRPIVPKPRIKEVFERVDHAGRVVVPLNEESARAAARELVAEGVEAIGVCFLWSFKNRAHEQRMREILLEEAPGLHVSISSDIVPAMREYERSATTAVNAYLAPLLTTYLEQLEAQLKERGLASPMLVMQSVGGAMRAADAEERAVNTLASGPAGGVVAARHLGEQLGHDSIICADVGGTSFDVGLIVDGEPIITSTTDVNQYTLLVPTIDIVSIGAGGGSIAWVDLGRLRVGPQSAGADPGPACYGRGGVEPTVTDANVVLGYIDPDYFLGGTIKLDRELAREAVRERVAEPLGMSLQDAAAGIVEIANHHMSDLMRKMTVERGYDPRDFVVYAFGGAGPLHGSAFARELGVREVIFPLGNIASAFSAFGLAVSDVTTVTQLSDLQLAPFEPERINRNLAQLEQDVRAKLTAENLGPKDVDVQRIFALRYKGQVHEVDTPVGPGTLGPAELEGVIDDFERRYETLYGRGSGFRQAGIELVTYRVMATARVQDAAIERQDEGDPDPAAALLGREQLYWHGHGLLETAVYGTGLRPGVRFAGPAVVRLEATTGLVHPGEQAVLDGYGNIRISLAGAA